MLQTGAAADDYAVLNQGQLKNLATAAVAEFNDKLVGGAGADLTQMVASWQNGSVPRDDYAAVNVGQLKALAARFYDRLGQPYPWTGSPQPADDYALANIGQAKELFSFAPQRVLPAWWLEQFGLAPNTDPNALMPGSGGMTYWAALTAGIDPRSVLDTDGDAVKDFEDAVPYDPALKFKRIPEPHYAVIDIGETESQPYPMLGDGGHVAWRGAGGYHYWPDASGGTGVYLGIFEGEFFPLYFLFPVGLDASGRLVGEMYDELLDIWRPAWWNPTSSDGPGYLGLPSSWQAGTYLGYPVWGGQGQRSGPSDNSENYTTFDLVVPTAGDLGPFRRRETSIIKHTNYSQAPLEVDHVVNLAHPPFAVPLVHPPFGVPFVIGPAQEQGVYWQTMGGGCAISIKSTKTGTYYGSCDLTSPDEELYDYTFWFVPSLNSETRVMKFYGPFGERILESGAQLRHLPTVIASPNGRWIAGCDTQADYGTEVLLPEENTWVWHRLYASKDREPIRGAWGRAFGQLLVTYNDEDRLWINGQARSFQEFIPAASWERYSDWRYEDMNGTGTVVATAKKVKNDDGSDIPTAAQKWHVVVLTPIEIKWEAKSGWNNVDDNPDPFSTDNKIVGKRIFPDAPEPNGDWKKELKVKVSVPGLSNTTVYLKVFDVDDPTPIDDPGHKLDPTDTDSKKAGNDNMHAPEVMTQGWFLPSHSERISVALDSSGNAEARFEVTPQPGNNYRVAVALKDQDLDSLQVDDSNAQGYVTPDDKQVGTFAGAISPLQTVWRKLNIEVDSMEKVPDNKPAPDHVTATGDHWVTEVNGSKTLQLSTTLPEGNGFYNGGKIKSGTEEIKIVSHTANSINIGFKPTSGSFIGPIDVYDDDDTGIAGAVLPKTNVISQGVKDIYKRGYIDIVEIASARNPRKAMPFELYSEHDTWGTTTLLSTKDTEELDSAAFWCHYLIVAYQPRKTLANDPDGSGLVEGVTSIGGNMFAQRKFSAVFVETIREHEALRPNIAPAYAVRQDEIVSHEIGHAPGCKPGHPESSGLMKDDPFDHEFSAESLLRFRKTQSWEASW